MDSTRSISPQQKGTSGISAASRRRSTWAGHGVTGVILIFGTSLLLGLPFSLHPTALFFNALTSAALGFPMGYVISRLGGGSGRGAALGAGMLATVDLTWSLVSGSGTSIPDLVVSLSVGGVLGAVLGWHVEQGRG